MSRLIFCLIFALASAILLKAQEESIDSFEVANNAYLEGDYFLAQSIYEAALESGIASADIFYNLGAIHYQSGQIGDAMLYFRRAQQLEPRNTELNKLIARIRAERVDFQGDDRNVIDQLASTTIQILTVQELRLIVFILWNIFFVLGLVWFLWKSFRRWVQPPLIVIGGLLVISLFLWLPRQYAETSRPSAVVTAIIAPVMSGPGESYLELYRIYAAAEIRLLDTQEGWFHFVLPDGREGWISEVFVTEV